MSEVKKAKKAKSPSVLELMAGLREDGYTIRVHHIRYFPWMAIKEDEESSEVEKYMTRGQYNQAKEDGTLVFHIMNVKDMDRHNEILPEYGNSVSPRGGWTRVTIEKAGEITTFGKKSFGRQKNFCRKSGVRGAFKMAYNVFCQRRLEQIQQTTNDILEQIQQTTNDIVESHG